VDLVDVEPGFERAAEAAIGASLAAVVVDTGPTARRVLDRLRAEGAAGLVLPALRATEPDVTPGDRAVSIRTVVRPRQGVAGDVAIALARLLARCVCVDDLDTAIDLAVERPDLVVVTAAGDRLAASGWRAAAGSAGVTRAAVEEAPRRAAQGAEQAGAAEAEMLQTRAELDVARA